MSDAVPGSDPTPDPALERRRLLRGGAVLAGVAGAGVVGAALAAQPATAAPLPSLLLGQENEATDPTSLRIDGETGGPDPALALRNADGPSLALQALDAEWGGDLEVGQLANTEVGPVIGVDLGEGAEVTYLATGFDLEGIPMPIAIPPQRVLDTRVTAGRAAIVRSSRSALDSHHRLRRGAWIDVAVLPTVPGLGVGAAFVNLTAVHPLHNGYLALGVPDQERPGTSTVNFQAGRTVSNGAFAAVALVEGSYAVRVHASQACHVVLDLTGAVAQGTPGENAAGRSPAGRALALRRARQAKTVARLRRAAR